MSENCVQGAQNKIKIKEHDRRINKNEDKIDEIFDRMPRVEEIVQNFSRNFELLNDTMRDVVETNSQVKESIVIMTGELKNVKEDQVEIDSRVKDLEKSSNINIIEFIKDNMVKALVLILSGGGIATVINKVIEFVSGLN